MAIYVLIVSLEKGTKDTAVFLNRASSLANDQKVHVGLQSQKPTPQMCGNRASEGFYRTQKFLNPKGKVTQNTRSWFLEHVFQRNQCYSVCVGTKLYVIAHYQ